MSRVDFRRLAAPLKSIEIDFNYAKTRKALDPKWNGYDMPKGHDIINDDSDLEHCNLVTSQHKANTNMHRVLLDLDYGASIETGVIGGHRITLNMRTNFLSNGLEQELKNMLARHSISGHINWSVGGGVVYIDTNRDVCFYESSTPDHHHLILGADMPWPSYTAFLTTLASCGIIENGYAKASIGKGYSALRPPWVHK